VAAVAAAKPAFVRDRFVERHRADALFGCGELVGMVEVAHVHAAEPAKRDARQVDRGLIGIEHTTGLIVDDLGISGRARHDETRSFGPRACARDPQDGASGNSPESAAVPGSKRSAGPLRMNRPSGPATSVFSSPPSRGTVPLFVPSRPPRMTP